MWKSSNKLIGGVQAIECITSYEDRATFTRFQDVEYEINSPLGSISIIRRDDTQETYMVVVSSYRLINKLQDNGVLPNNYNYKPGEEKAIRILADKLAWWIEVLAIKPFPGPMLARANAYTRSSGKYHAA